MIDLSAGLSLDIARSRSVLIGAPVYRETTPWFTNSLWNTAALLFRLGIRCEFSMIVGKAVHLARNDLAVKLLDSDHSDLLFVDADMGWDAESVVRLLASHHPLIGGAGRKKTPQPNSDPNAWCFGADCQPGDRMRTDKAGAIEITAIGTGFLLVNRSVFEAMRPAHGDDFFGYDKNDNGTLLGEDITFCRRFRALGGEVWLDPEITLSHFGTAEYRGDVRELFNYQ